MCLLLLYFNFLPTNVIYLFTLTDNMIYINNIFMQCYYVNFIINKLYFQYLNQHNDLIYNFKLLIYANFYQILIK